MAAVRQINKRLGSVAAAVEARVKDTMITQAALIASEIKSIAPVDPESANPGELKASVRVIEGKSTAKKAFVVKVAAGNLKTTSGGKPFNWVRGVEFGTQHSPAHAFFWPIWRLRRKGARVAIRKAAVNEVRKVWGDK